MNRRQTLATILNGDKPSRIPFCIFDLFLNQIRENNEAQRLLDLGVSQLAPLTRCHREIGPDVQEVHLREVVNGLEGERIIIRTSLGDISQTLVEGWIQEYLLKTPEDYRIMEYIVRNTKITQDYSQFEDKENKLGDTGISLACMWRTPMQTILVDYAGLENFCYHLGEGWPEIFSLAEALEEQLLQKCRVVAEGPCRYAYLLENLTAETWGPVRYAKFHMPVYEKLLSILRPRDKKLYVHYDGKLTSIAHLIAESGLGGIDSLTIPPEGDISLKDARKLWPDKTFFVNVNLEYYNLQERELRAKIREMVEDAAPDGKNTWLQISEGLPERWKESIPIILDELEKIRI